MFEIAVRLNGQNDADVQQLKAILSAEMIKVLDRDELSVRGAQRINGIPAADLSRIRKRMWSASRSIA